MASTRRRPSAGFDTPSEKIEETPEVSLQKEEEEVIEEVIAEESAPEPPVKEEPPKVVTPPTPVTVATVQPKAPTTKRHPRNIPKFSRIK
jgi:hypothetical protein